MTPFGYYQREKARRLAQAPPRLFGPTFEDLGVIVIPPPAVLAEMVAEPLDPAGEAWLRRQLAGKEAADGRA
jgi:hypothetical protein